MFTRQGVGPLQFLNCSGPTPIPEAGLIHSSNKYFLGIPKEKTIILEDVTTTGESLLNTIDNLLEINVQVVAAIGLTNRNELRDDKKSVQKAVEEKGIPYYAMSNALDLLPEVYKKLQSKKNIAKFVEEYFEKYGVEKMNLK